jgi:phosphatidate cytidylyltransferase
MDRNMMVRAVAGLVFIAVVIGAVIHSFWSTFLLFGIISVIGSYEFYKLRKSLSPGLIPAPVILTVVLYYYTPFIAKGLDWPVTEATAAVAVLLTLCLILTDLFKKDQVGFPNLTNGLFAAFYIAIPFVLLTLSAGGGSNFDNHDPSLIIYFFIVLWSNDTFAYLTGKMFGRHKLWERISPKKTWEGFIGGVIFAMLAAAICSYHATGSIDFLSTLFGLIIAVFATLGDLSESLLKRQAGVKDSGNVIPGHGGILDRFDGVLLSVPAVLVAYTIIHFFQ